MPNLFSVVSNLFKPAQSKFPSDSTTEPAQITQSKVLLIVFDPVMDKTTGTTLSQQLKWFRPADLITGFMADMLEVSGGMARYQIVQRVDVDGFPAKTDGFRYTPQTYLEVLRGSTALHVPQEVNYNASLVNTTSCNVWQGMKSMKSGCSVSHMRAFMNPQWADRVHSGVMHRR